jgi:glycosyltransferase involved in cell wall biosynthesis
VARRAFGLNPSEILIGYLGQAYPSDAALIAAAIQELRQILPCRLLLIGAGKTNIAGYIGDSNAVLETGYVQTGTVPFNNYLAACDLMWLPLKNTLANRGRWPMKINDYLAAGRATVSTRSGDWVRLFQGARPVGTLADDDPHDLACTTATLLDDEPARLLYEKNARLVAEECFAWPVVTADLEAFYKTVLEQRK